MRKYLENIKILFYFHLFVAFFASLCFANCVFAAGSVSFLADTTINLSGISEGDLSVANTSQAESINVNGSVLTVSAIPNDGSFILKTVNHDSALKLTPSGGTVDLNFDSAHLFLGNISEWTLASTGSTQVDQIISVPLASTWYAINVDGILYGKYQSNFSSEVKFVYSGSWSAKIFTIIETTPPVIFNNDTEITLEEGEEDTDVTNGVSNSGDSNSSDDSDKLYISKPRYEAFSNSIIVKWKTNRDANSHVRYGVDESLEKEKYYRMKVENHQISLNNLNPDTLYYFRMKSTDKNGNTRRTKIYSARTAKAINWGVGLTDFFVNQNKEKNTESTKDIIDQINEIPEKIQEKLEETKFFNANVFKKAEQKYLSEVKFKLVDKFGSPIANTLVTLHSDPQTTTTDGQGIATFQNVPTGKHKLVFNYNNENRQFAVNIQEPKAENGEVQLETVVIEVGEKSNTRIYYLAGVSVIIIIFLTFKRKKKKE